MKKTKSETIQVGRGQDGVWDVDEAEVIVVEVLVALLVIVIKVVGSIVVVVLWDASEDDVA